MNIDQIGSLLESPDQARSWLSSLGFQKPAEAHANFVKLAEDGFTIDLLSNLSDQIERLMPTISDPDVALANLELFVRASRSPIALGSLFERDPTSLPILMQIFAISPFLSELLIRDPGGYDLLRLTEGMPVPREALIDELCEEISVLTSGDAAKELLRRFRQRELLRIAYGDIIRGQSVQTVSAQLSYVADAICAAALSFATRDFAVKRGDLFGLGGSESKIAIIAIHSLGGNEISYSDDLSLLMISDMWSSSDDRSSSVKRKFLRKVATETIGLISDPTEDGFCFHVSQDVRPEGRDGSIVSNVHRSVQYLEQLGRVWDRLEFVKARFVAGHQGTADDFLNRIQSWIYPGFLSRADISGIRALRRGISRGLADSDHSTAGDDTADSVSEDSRQQDEDQQINSIKSRVRDIETTIQFLQLLHGGDTPSVRRQNTLAAITQMEQHDCLTTDESDTLQSGYEFFRQALHVGQIMSLSADRAGDSDRNDRDSIEPSNLRDHAKIAALTGFVDGDESQRIGAFNAAFAQQQQAVSRVLDHLVGDAFPGDAQSEGQTDGQPADQTDANAEAIADLVLDPNPGNSLIDKSLTPYGFQDAQVACQHLQDLARERFRFLSTRRCRHFLAAIVGELFSEIAKTPNPDQTLQNLARVSDSLGGKGLLWELFSFNRASLQLFVRLCASSRYLKRILIGNPGMIDELLDALMINELPDTESLRSELAALTVSAESIDLILKGFRNSHHLSVGIRDIFGRDDIQETHRALSDIAEVCLEQIAKREFDELAARHGSPRTSDGRPCELIILAMGKLGGREPNYHSDLDVVFMYQADGETHHRDAKKVVSNNHFFSILSSRISSVVNSPHSGERLYELDSRLRPSGRSGPAVLSLEHFVQHFRNGKAKTWERLALCKARPIICSQSLRELTREAIATAIGSQPWNDDTARQIHDIRMQLQEGASKSNLKRGQGGTLDIEFAIQLLQLKHHDEHPDILVPGTMGAIDRLSSHQLISDEDQQFFNESYQFLRKIESRLRLMMTNARHELPEDQETLEHLVWMMDIDSIEKLLTQVGDFRRENRERFLRIVQSS